MMTHTARQMVLIVACMGTSVWLVSIGQWQAVAGAYGTNA